MPGSAFDAVLRDVLAERGDGAVLRGTSDDLERFVASMPATARAAARLGGYLARTGAGGRLADLARDLAAMAYYEQPSVRAALGYEPQPWIEDRARRRRERWADDIEAHRRLLLAGRPDASPSAIRSGTELPPDLEVDAVVVGSGAGGAVAAAELAEAGLSVAVLEEGEHHRTESFGTHTLDTLRQLYRDSGASTTLGRAPVQFSEGRCVGGSTVVNGAMAFRASPRVLARWRAESGIGFDLDEEYARVERLLSVGPPDPGSVSHDQELLRTGAERLGWRVVECRRAHVHCGGCNVCVWGCPTGAKQSTLVSYLPRATAFGATVWTGCRVERVLMRGKRAVGVTGRAAGGRFTVRARSVVLAAGAVQTPLLLLRSGIGTPSRQVGRNLTLHPGAAVTAVFDDVVDGWQGAHESYQVREFEDAGVILAAVNLPPSLTARTLRLRGAALHTAMADYRRMVTAGVLVEDTGSGRVRPAGDRAVVTYPVSARDAARVVGAVVLLGEAMLAAGARRLYLPIAGTAPVGSVDALRRLAEHTVAPHRLDLTTVHLMGTVRMGNDPIASACDASGRVRDADRLFVADASLFPGPVGVNPQLTVMALATRVAGRIIDAW